MNPIPNTDAWFRPVSDVIKLHTAPYTRSVEWRIRTQVNGRNNLDTYSFFENVEDRGGVVMIKNLCKIYIKICLARIVVYSQRHVC
jgi:hypothetical protein